MAFWIVIRYANTTVFDVIRVVLLHQSRLANYRNSIGSAADVVSCVLLRRGQLWSDTCDSVLVSGISDSKFSAMWTFLVYLLSIKCPCCGAGGRPQHLIMRRSHSG